MTQHILFPKFGISPPAKKNNEKKNTIEGIPLLFIEWIIKICIYKLFN